MEMRGRRPEEAKPRSYRLSNCRAGASPADPWNGKRERLPYKTRSLPTLTRCFLRSYGSSARTLVYRFSRSLHCRHNGFEATAGLPIANDLRR